MPHRYPYLAQDRLLAQRLDNDFEMSAGPTPPSGAAGGAGQYKFWMDISVNPPALRMVTVARATPGVYVASEWATLATLDLTNRVFNFTGGGTASFASITVANNITSKTLQLTGTGYPLTVGVGGTEGINAGNITLNDTGVSVLYVPNGGIFVGGSSGFGDSITVANNITSKALQLIGTGYILTVGSGVGGGQGIAAGYATLNGTGNAVLYVPNGGILVGGASAFGGSITVADNITSKALQLTGTGYILTVGSGVGGGGGQGIAAGYATLNGTGNSVLYVPNGGIYAAGANSCQYIYGGAGGAGSLRCWNTGNVVCFRWNGSNLSFRLDEVLENTLPYVLNFNGFHLDGGGGPAGFELAAYSGSTPFVIYVDAVSDARLKDNIRDTEIDALGAILATPVREFDWNSDGRRYMPFIEPHAPIGLVAQEVQEHMPFVVGVKNYPEKDDVPVHDMHRVMYDRMAAYFVRAIQQLHDEITDLKKRLN